MSCSVSGRFTLLPAGECECRNFYHFECIRTWHLTSTTCPTCRGPISKLLDFVLQDTQKLLPRGLNPKNSDPLDYVKCDICERSDGPDASFLLCTTCPDKAGCHLSCFGLDSLPTWDYHCRSCVILGKAPNPPPPRLYHELSPPPPPFKMKPEPQPLPPVLASAASKDPKPHKCDFCNKGFEYKSGVTRHRKTHLNLKEFQCPSCEESFNRKDTLKDHQLIHLAEKPFGCSKCGFRTSHRNSIRRHKNSCKA